MFLITFYMKKGMLEEALGESKKLALLEPESTEAQELLGEINLRLGNRDEAKVHYLRLIELLQKQSRFKEAREIEKEISWKFLDNS
jgi:Flp pilus assembly protein TadD